MGTASFPVDLPPPSSHFSRIEHSYTFDPTHDYSLDALLACAAPDEPPDYAEYWRGRHAMALHVQPRPRLHDTGVIRHGWRVFDWTYHSTGLTEIRGWALLPASSGFSRAMVVGHGYGGREAPDFDLPFEDAALFFPCARGLGRSATPSISPDPQWHVIHDIQSRRRYVLGGCIEDLWCGVTALLDLFPHVAGRIGYLGISFGGGIGAMATAWDQRIRLAHFNVPTFGNQPLRMKLATIGSAAAVQHFVKKCPKALDVLRYFDAASAARHFSIPVHFACALFDPAVAPAGQFAIHNASPASRQLFVLTAGHHSYPGQDRETAQLRQEIHNFFMAL